jgi:hypothetical protein
VSSAVTGTIINDVGEVSAASISPAIGEIKRGKFINMSSETEDMSRYMRSTCKRTEKTGEDLLIM